MFDRDGRLLYVGISQRATRRFDEHGREKPWWNDVEQITVEHFPTREAVEVAERRAIRSESPLHNKQRYGADPISAPRHVPAAGEYLFTSINGHTRRGPGALWWELSGDPISDDYLPDEVDAHRLFHRWLCRREEDAMGYVPIYWGVRGPGIFETAMPDRRFPTLPHYAEFYLPPVDADTGRMLNLADLPVIDKSWRIGNGDKGGFIQEATGWKPAPLQDSVPVAMLVRLAMARVAPYDDTGRTHCPACGHPATCSTGTDRYYHDEGSKDRACQRAIMRGQVR
jgi:hypothetical protein